MAIPVKLARVKSRAKRRGRPKYKYVLRWQDGDGWHQESCRTSDRKAAETMRKRKFAELNGLVDPDDPEADPEPAVSWEELEERTQAALESRGRAASTADGYRRSVRVFRELSEAGAPAETDAAAIERFIAARREAGVGPAAINRDLRQLRTVFNRAIRRDELDANPFSNFERLTEDQKEIRTLDDGELQRVCGYFAGLSLVQTFLLVSLQTGCRIAELAHLLWDDVEPSSGWLMIREKTLPDGRRWRPKSRAGIRDAWLPPWLMARLASLQLAGKPFVWTRHLVELGAAFDGQFNPRRFVPYVQHRIADCCEATGVRFSHHDLRRTQQSWLREHGWGDAVCLAIAGQGTGATVLRDHYWRPNHRRMTRPAFDDAARIFSDSGLLEGDPLGESAQLAPKFAAGNVSATRVG